MFVCFLSQGFRTNEFIVTLRFEWNITKEYSCLGLDFARVSLPMFKKFIHIALWELWDVSWYIVEIIDSTRIAIDKGYS